MPQNPISPHKNSKISRDYLIRTRSSTISKFSSDNLPEEEGNSSKVETPVPRHKARINFAFQRKSLQKAYSNSLRISPSRSDPTEMARTKELSYPVEFFLRSQASLEESILRKIEEVLKKNRLEEEKLKALNILVLESRIDELKKENEEYKKNKLENEAESERLKESLKQVTNIGSDGQHMNMNFSINYAPTKGCFPTQAFIPPVNQEAMSYYASNYYSHFPGNMYQNIPKASNFNPGYSPNANHSHHVVRRASNESQSNGKNSYDENPADSRHTLPNELKVSHSNVVQFKSSFRSNDPSANRKNPSQQVAEGEEAKPMHKIHALDKLIADVDEPSAFNSIKTSSFFVIEDDECNRKTRSNTSPNLKLGLDSSIKNNVGVHQEKSQHEKPAVPALRIYKAENLQLAGPTDSDKRYEHSSNLTKPSKEAEQKQQAPSNLGSDKSEQLKPTKTMTLMTNHPKRVIQRRDSGSFKSIRNSGFKKNNVECTFLEQQLDPSTNKNDLDFLDLITKDSERHGTSMLNQMYYSIQEGFISPRPFHLLYYSDLLVLPEESKIKQAYFGLDDENKYTVECQLAPDAVEPIVKFILFQQAIAHAHSYKIAEEVIKLSSLMTLMEYIDFEDCVPSSVTLKSIKSYKNFVKYFVMPFLWVQVDEESMKKRIEIRAKPRGLTTKRNEHVFLGETCRVSLIFVGGTNLKIVLDPLNLEAKTALRFDLNMDQESFGKYFERTSDSKHENMGATITKVIEVLSDDAAEAEELDDINNFFQQFGNRNVVNDEIEACRFKDKNGENPFWETLVEMLSAAEIYLTQKGLSTLYNMADSKIVKYIKFRVWEDNRKKDITLIVEDIEQAEFKIHLKNLFETHAPEGKKILAEGSFSYGFERLWMDFGVQYKSTDYEDRLALCSVISECFRLEIYEKKLELSDYPSFYKNTISRYPIDSGCFERIHKGQSSKYPVTFSLIGVKGHPIGVKATIYHPETCSERGVFFLLETTNWKKLQLLYPSAKKQRSKKFPDLPMVEEYYLTYILKTYGFKILEDYLEFAESDINADILGVKAIKAGCSIDILENPLSFEGIIRYFRKKTDLLVCFDNEEEES